MRFATGSNLLVKPHSPFLVFQLYAIQAFTAKLFCREIRLRAFLLAFINFPQSQILLSVVPLRLFVGAIDVSPDQAVRGLSRPKISNSGTFGNPPAVCPFASEFCFISLLTFKFSPLRMLIIAL